MKCPQCLRARQTIVHQQYTEGCIGCVVRKLAYMDWDGRQRYLDRVQHVVDYDTRRELSRSVHEECARIEALRLRQRAKSA